ncbi:hypothetical protein [Paenibacillus amylolyticus]|uniref:hypothetical protein n=1 Tax=Paenibacillus amylolyticus TaxID=1451 RepID=UPI003398FC22
MIKIPEIKCKGLPDIFLNHTKYYVRDILQFYLNCCEIVANKLSTHEVKINLSTYTHSTRLFSLLEVIADPFYYPSKKIKKKLTKIPSLKKLDDVFQKKLLKKEFTAAINEYTTLFENMLDPDNEIYYENILISKPDKLMIIYNELCSRFTSLQDSNGKVVLTQSGVGKGLVHDLISKIFNYGEFLDGFKQPNSKIKWGAFDLCDHLDVNVCPYCNRMFTFTIIKKANRKALTRPELDHFFPQSMFPLFAISFYNLIPSCKICNSSFKRDDYLKLEEYLHPYLGAAHSQYKFDYKPLDVGAYDGDMSKIHVIINKNGYTCKKTNASLEKFEIEEIYKRHSDVVSELLFKRLRYSDSRIQDIARLFREAGEHVTESDIFNSIFPAPKSSEYIDQSLGKLRSDITEKLRVLK